MSRSRERGPTRTAPPVPVPPLRLGETLLAARSALVAAPGPLLALAALGHVPYAALAIGLAAGARWDEATVWTWIAVDRAYGLLAGPLIGGAVVYAVLTGLRGEPVRVGAAVAAVARRARPLVGIAAIGVIGLLGAGLLTTGPTAWLVGMTPLSPTARAIVVLAVAALPALGVLTALTLAAPVVMVEGGDAGGAAARSWQLARGSIPTIAALVLLSLGPELTLEVAMVREALTAPASEVRESVRSLFVLSALASVAAALLAAVAGATAYHLLRARRDGVSSDGLAVVFE